jgi:hypothetical protein
MTDAAVKMNIDQTGDGVTARSVYDLAVPGGIGKQLAVDRDVPLYEITGEIENPRVLNNHDVSSFTDHVLGFCAAIIYELQRYFA